MLAKMQAISPILKAILAGISAVCMVAYQAPLPTNTEGWVHYVSFMIATFIGGATVYRMQPNAPITAQQVAANVIDKLTSGPPTRQVGNAPVAVEAAHL